jgi:hypothetical protein
MTNEKAKSVETVRELSVRELDAVNGGLNPQPLPPGLREPMIRFLNPQPLPPG